jgi:hypothetical protein
MPHSFRYENVCCKLLKLPSVNNMVESLGVHSISTRFRLYGKAILIVQVLKNYGANPSLFAAVSDDSNRRIIEVQRPDEIAFFDVPSCR